MNIEKIIQLGERDAAALSTKGIKNPMMLDDNYILVVNPYAGFRIHADELPPDLVSAAHKDIGEKVLSRLTSDLSKKDSDVAAFHTTVGDLVAWLRKDTEPCSICSGTGPCPSVELDDAGDTSPEVEDANSLHYGWLGVAPIRRSRLDELLSYLELPDTTGIGVITMMLDRPSVDIKGEDVDFYSMVQIHGETGSHEFDLYLAGLSEKTEAAPKFHMEGKFEKLDLKKAGKTKITSTAAPIEGKAEEQQKTKKKAAPKAGQKKAAKPVATKKLGPKPVEPKKPVGKTKVISKAAPIKPSGSSILDRARAKKLAGKKK